MLPEATATQKHEGPRRCRRGPSWSADRLSASAYPTPPSKDGAYVRRCGGRGARCSWRDECRPRGRVSSGKVAEHLDGVLGYARASRREPDSAIPLESGPERPPG